MVEETGVIESAPAESTEEVAMPTADSSYEEIQAYADKYLGDEETQSESPAEETQESDASGEDVKTQEPIDDSKSEEGKAIPYERFKQINDKLKDYEGKASQYEADLHEMQEVLKDPEVLEMIMRKRGYTDEAIDKYMAEKGVQKPVPKGEVDLSTPEGWQSLIDRKIQESLTPVISKLSSFAQKEERAEAERWIAKQSEEAKKLATDVYGIEYGDETRDATNTQTAVGKISTYLQNHPEDAKLGHAKLLKLAISEEGFKGAKEKGKQDEIKRIEKVKSASMESDAFHSKEERPDKNWSTERILEYAEKHPNYKLSSDY